MDTWPFPRGKEWEMDLARNLSGYFKKMGYPVSQRYPFVLARRADWHKNIILARVWKYIEEERRQRRRNRAPFALHRWLHHGLSSQAFLFNLLGPLVVDKQWSIFDDILNQTGITLSSHITGATFELEDRKVFNERQGQPTSIDLCLWTGHVEKVFIEFKFTEKTFGGCSVFRSGDCDGINPSGDFDLCYLHRIDRKYWQLIKKHSLLTATVRNSFQCPFSELYQLYRLILFTLEKDCHFLLLYDERNPCFLVNSHNIKRGLFNLVYQSLPKYAQSRCHALSVQSILPILKKQSTLDWTNELEDKYFQ